METKGIVISDCDGCLTDGKFVYTVDGKVAKVFGPHDNDGVKMLKKLGYDILFITADARGFDITAKRIKDMKCNIMLVSEDTRDAFVSSYIKPYSWSCFFGDGISDINAGKCVNFFACPANARKEVKSVADFITESKGGEGAFLDLAIEITKRNT